MTSWIPPQPAGAVKRVSSPLRYEDLAQDGRVLLTALPHAVGTAVWKYVPETCPGVAQGFAAGVVPLLTRLICEGSDETMTPRDPWELEGAFELAHHGDSDEDRRLFFNVWTQAHGPRGRVHGRVEGAGARILMGRCFAEHTFTRPFAPPGQRKLSRLALAGVPEIPAPTYAFTPPERRLELLAGATWLEDQLAPQGDGTVFGLMHTDPNQHVNSLVYPRIFEEAALHRLAALGLGSKLLACRLDVAYRKPAFAGDRAEVHLRALRLGQAVGAVGAIVPAGAPITGAHCFLQMLFW